MKKIFILFLVVFLSISATYANTLKGYVTDQQSGEPLVGATVILENTKFATSVGLDGSYEIKGIPAGKYQCKIQYIGYAPTVKTIEIEKTQTILKLDFSLKEQFNELNEITVNATSDRETDNSARKTEQKSDNVLNIISARTIQLLPDITVGNVLQRVSGVSVVRNSTGDGQYAVIRGMDKRYNFSCGFTRKIGSC